MQRAIVSALVFASFLLTAAPVTYAKDVGQGEKVFVEPAQGRVGTRFKVMCKDLPEPTSFDIVYIVPAGTPDIDLNTPAGQDLKVLWRDYASNCYKSGQAYGIAGPFAPGAYEVRFQTTLYNNDKRGEIAARTSFIVK